MVVVAVLYTTAICMHTMFPTQNSISISIFRFLLMCAARVQVFFLLSYHLRFSLFDFAYFKIYCVAMESLETLHALNVCYVLFLISNLCCWSTLCLCCDLLPPAAEISSSRRPTKSAIIFGEFCEWFSFSAVISSELDSLLNWLQGACAYYKNGNHMLNRTIERLIYCRFYPSIRLYNEHQLNLCMWNSTSFPFHYNWYTDILLCY